MNPLILIIGAGAALYFATKNSSKSKEIVVLPIDPVEPALPWEPDPLPDPPAGKTPMPAAVAAALGFSSVYTLQRDWNSIVALVNKTAIGAGLWAGMANLLAKVPPLKKLSVDGDYGSKTRAVAEFALVPNVDFGALVNAAKSEGF